jgi:hypothetical protein
MVPSPPPDKVPLSVAARPKRKASHNLDNTLLPNIDPVPTNSSRTSKRKKAPSSSDKQSNEQHGRLQDKSLECINLLLSTVNNAVSVSQSLDWLDTNPMARNVLMVVSPNRMPACTTQEVLHAHLGPHTQDGFLPDRKQHGTNDAHKLKFTPVLRGPLKVSSSKLLGTKRVSYCVENVIPCIWCNYPNLSARPGMVLYGCRTTLKALLTFLYTSSC